MKLFDIIAMAMHNLRQRRLRTVLNLIGVVIGCIVLLLTAAGAGGVRDAFQSLFDASEMARQIEVFPSYGSSTQEPPEGAVMVSGDIPAERRERIRKALVTVWKNERYDWHDNQISPEKLKLFGGIEHVKAVVPNAYLQCRVSLADEASGGVSADQPDRNDSSPLPGADDQKTGADEEIVQAGIGGAGPPSDAMQRSIIAGTVLEDNDRAGALMHEFLAYRLGFRSDDELEQLAGRRVKIELRIEGRASSLFHMMAEQMQRLSPDYINKQLQFIAAFHQLIEDLDLTSLSEAQKLLLRNAITEPAETRRELQDVVVSRTFIVRGIYRHGANTSLASLFRQQLLGEHVHLQLHRDVITELRLLDPAQQYFHNAVVIVNSARHLQSVSDQLQEHGMHTQSALQVIAGINWQIDQNSWIVYGVATAILLTAAIGISNTLIISVMERTPEFGIMKSLGAKDGDLVMLLVIEGAVLGLIGATVAFVLSWSLSFGVQLLLERYIENQISGDITGRLFRFSLLPALIMVTVSVTVCVIASIVPAIRAARLDPVVAMRRT